MPRVLELLALPFSSVSNLIGAGGWVLPLIFICALLMWTLIAERWWFFRVIYPARRAALQAEWRARADRHSWAARQVRQMLISQARVAMDAPLPLLRVTVPIAPLLGLLGTVTGMLEVFDGMLVNGSADSRTMAFGVSHAMIATLAGLVVSVSGMFFLNRFQTRIAREAERFGDTLEFEAMR
ncbi:MotA/TolQ/ExbB proton channel family protein [Solimonas marina]|uniref:MotA/TolQ/ExbB proton channel family protein n=1 Tax=Solimonas marina TaxID=2714601 RepID=A0A969WCX2_9GAMM|nr:MotA/TolQ/ExbB proton channel family protein [Solimonas marina]NKF23785.1 MotA/TolQ/ExbB proton channel family protein [Solimonas marina]